MKRNLFLSSALGAFALFLAFSLVGTADAVTITNTNTNTYTPSYTTPSYAQPSYYPRTTYSVPQPYSPYYQYQNYGNGYQYPQYQYNQYGYQYPYYQSCSTYGQFAPYNPQCTCPSGEQRNSVGRCVPIPTIRYYNEGREGCWTRSGRFSYNVDDRACRAFVNGVMCMWDEFRRCVPISQNAYADMCTRIDVNAYYEYDSTDPGCYCQQGYRADSDRRKCVQTSRATYYEEWQRRLGY